MNSSDLSENLLENQFSSNNSELKESFHSFPNSFQNYHSLKNEEQFEKLSINLYDNNKDQIKRSSIGKIEKKQRFSITEDFCSLNNITHKILKADSKSNAKIIEIDQKISIENEPKKSLKMSFYTSSPIEIYIRPRDLTNRLVNLLNKSNYYLIWSLLLMTVDFVFRVYFMIYLYEIYIRDFYFRVSYLCLFYLPRIVYSFSMIKILFNVNIEDTYMNRICLGYNIIDDINIYELNEQFKYDFILNFQNKVNFWKKFQNKPFFQEKIELIKGILKRFLLAIFPCEIAFLFFLFAAKKNIFQDTNKVVPKLIVINSWVYKSYEIYCLIVIILLFIKENENWSFYYSRDSTFIFLTLLDIIVFVFIILFLILNRNSYGIYKFESIC